MNEKRNQENERTKDSSLTPKPDPETLHTTDPQEHMEGPISSLMHQTGEGFETTETKKEADEEKDKKI